MDRKISEKIRMLRRRLNLSQERFGKKIGISGKTVSAYENSRCEPPLKILEKITEVYNETFLNIKGERYSDVKVKIQQIKDSINEIERVFGFEKID